MMASNLEALNVQPIANTIGELDDVGKIFEEFNETIEQTIEISKNKQIVEMDLPSISSSQASSASVLKDFEGQANTNVMDNKPETVWQILSQIIVPFMGSGFCSIFAGILLNQVIQKPVFQSVPQIEIMIPSFIGMIGNIETTFASRVSTQSNLGLIDSRKEKIGCILGNLLVVVCQSILIGLFVALMSLVFSSLLENSRENLSIDLAIFLCSASIVSSIVSNFLIASIVTAIVLVSQKFHFNPDNITTPVAASMGDVCTIFILSFVCELFFDLPSLTLRRWLLSILLVLALLLALLFGYLARRNRWSKSVIFSGWIPILGAVLIEKPAGLIMENSFLMFPVISVFQPLVNGAGVNLVSIQASRLSTFLHASSKLGHLPPNHSKLFTWPHKVFLSNDINSKTALLLLMILIPAHLIFLLLFYALQAIFSFTIQLTAPFITMYMVAVFIQMLILLYAIRSMVLGSWLYRFDPDNLVIPLVSALADLLGIGLMTLAFVLLETLQDPNTGF